MFERVDGVQNATETPIGYIPKPGALDVKGLDISESTLSELFKIDKEAWKKEAAHMRDYLKIFGDKVPAGITKELDNLEARLNK